VRRVAIFTDSASDMDPQAAEVDGIGIVPLLVTFGDETFKAGEELSTKAFWDRMTAPDAPFPKTAASSPAEFKDAYEAAFSDGAEAVVSIHVASALSGTIKSAQIARDMLPDREIHVVDSLGASMAQGTYLSGRTLDPAPHLFLGAVENPGAPPYGYRVDRSLKKARAGARFLQLQVSFEPARLAAFMAEAVASRLAEQVALIPSICLVRSPKALRYIDEKVPGITVPPELIERCERAPDPEEECFEVACELAEQARALPGTAGLHLISFRREAGIARLCERLQIPTRVERETSGYRRPVAV